VAGGLYRNAAQSILQRGAEAQCGGDAAPRRQSRETLSRFSPNAMNLGADRPGRRREWGSPRPQGAVPRPPYRSIAAAEPFPGDGESDAAAPHPHQPPRQCGAAQRRQGDRHDRRHPNV